MKDMIKSPRFQSMCIIALSMVVAGVAWAFGLDGYWEGFSPAWVVVVVVSLQWAALRCKLAEDRRTGIDWLPIPEALARECAEKAWKQMAIDGWLYNDDVYVLDFRDCVAFARAFESRFYEEYYAVATVVPNKEPAAKRIDYTSRRGGGHTCLEVMINEKGDLLCFDSYPCTRDVFKMNAKEIKSREWRNFK